MKTTVLRFLYLIKLSTFELFPEHCLNEPPEKKNIWESFRRIFTYSHTWSVHSEIYVYILPPRRHQAIDCVWNVMAHAQKPDFVFLRNGRVYLNRPGASVQSTTGSRVLRISGSNAGYTMFRGSVKGTGYPLHSPVSPTLLLPCVTVCHYISTALYHLQWHYTNVLGTHRIIPHYTCQHADKLSVTLTVLTVGVLLGIWWKWMS